VFYDICAVVYFLRLVIWIDPRLHRRLQRTASRDRDPTQPNGRHLVTAAIRVLIEATKPT